MVIVCVVPLFPPQARDTYYSGHPLVGDDIFDKVEVHTSLRRECRRTHSDCTEEEAYVLSILYSLFCLLMCSVD